MPRSRLNLETLLRQNGLKWEYIPIGGTRYPRHKVRIVHRKGCGLIIYGEGQTIEEAIERAFIQWTVKKEQHVVGVYNAR